MIKRVPPPVKKAGSSSSLNKIKPPTSRIPPVNRPIQIQLLPAGEQPEDKIQNQIQNDQSNQQIESNSVSKEQQNSNQVQTVNAQVTQGLNAENTQVTENTQTKATENNKQSQGNTKQEEANPSEFVQIKVLPNIPKKLPPPTVKRTPGNVPSKVSRPQTKPPKPPISSKIQLDEQKAQIKEETVEILKQTEKQVAMEIPPKIQTPTEDIQTKKEVVQSIEQVKPDTHEIPENKQQVDIKDDQPQTKPIQVKPPPPAKKNPSQNRIPPPVKKPGPFQPPKISLTTSSIAEEKAQNLTPKQQEPRQISKISALESGISEKSSNVVQVQESIFEERTDTNFTPTSKLQRQNSVQNGNENTKQSLENQATVTLSRTASVPVAPVTKIPSPKKLPNLPRQNPPPVPKKQAPTSVPQPQLNKIQPLRVPSPPQPITQLPQGPSQPTQNPSTQYSELQQKLRKLQILRSRIDQSSQESYSNHDNIEEEESEVSLDRSNEKLGSEINVIDQRTINQEGQHHEVNDFRIGQTNYEEMQIKDHQQQQIQPIEQVQSDQIQVINETSLQPLSLSPQNRPLQSIYSSNIATEQTKHQYLPDEVSNSQQSEGSMARHHHIVVGLKNNVEHVDKYRSEMDFDSLTPEGKVVHGFDQIRESDLYEDRSDGDLGKVEKERDEITEHKHKIKDSSVQTVQDKGSGSNEIADQLKPQIIKSSQKPLQQASNTALAIQSLIAQFTSKKSQYLQNLQNLKQIQKRCTQQQLLHKERILKILQQVNHKNALILRHANGSSVKNDKQNNFLEGKTIGNILAQGDEL